MASYALWTQVQVELDFTLSERERAQVEQRIDMASEEAAVESGMAWADNTVPAIVRMLVINKVSRFMRNPDAYIQSRSGDETVVWADMGARAEAANWYWTEKELDILHGLGRPQRRFGVLAISPYGSKDPGPGTYFVPVYRSGPRADPFPWLSHDDPILK